MLRILQFYQKQKVWAFINMLVVIMKVLTFESLPEIKWIFRKIYDYFLRSVSSFSH